MGIDKNADVAAIKASVSYRALSNTPHPRRPRPSSRALSRCSHINVSFCNAPWRHVYSFCVLLLAVSLPLPPSLSLRTLPLPPPLSCCFGRLHSVLAHFGACYILQLLFCRTRIGTNGPDSGLLIVCSPGVVVSVCVHVCVCV